MTSSHMPAAPRRPDRTPGTTDRDVVAVIAKIARLLKSREDEISSGMSALMARDIDHLDDDPRLLDMLEASVAGNVATVIDVLINDIPIERLEPDPAAVEYALRLAQREVPVNSLVRAYHMGQQEMLRICYGELDRGELPAPLALAVVERLTEIIYGYIDWITGYVFDAYEAERTRWVDTRGSVRSSTVHSVLSADNPDISAFEHETGYPLGREHLALILWREGPEQASALDLLETRVRAIGPLLHTDGPAIVTAIDRRTVWAWLPFGRRPTADVTEIRSTCDLSEGFGWPSDCRATVRPGSGARIYRPGPPISSRPYPEHRTCLPRSASPTRGGRDLPARDRPGRHSIMGTGGPRRSRRGHRTGGDVAPYAEHLLRHRR